MYKQIHFRSIWRLVIPLRVFTCIKSQFEFMQMFYIITAYIGMIRLKHDNKAQSTNTWRQGRLSNESFYEELPNHYFNSVILQLMPKSVAIHLLRTEHPKNMRLPEAIENLALFMEECYTKISYNSYCHLNTKLDLRNTDATMVNYSLLVSSKTFWWTL